MGFFANGSLVYQTTSTATGGGTTTLAATSTQVQVFTGSSNQTVKLPPTTSAYAGQSYQIYNNSTGTLTIQYQDGTSFSPAPTVSPSSCLTSFHLTGTTDGTWVVQTPPAATQSVNGRYNSSTSSISSSLAP